MALLLGAHLLGASLSPLTWYLARASGLTLYLLVWLAVVTGLGLTTKALDRLGGRATAYSVHQFATELGLAFLALHVLSLALDETVPFGPAALFVPFVASWREPWTGLGVIAGYLAVAVGLSFGLARVISYGTWRALHWLTFPVYALALAHGLGAGSDAGTPWAIALYLTTGGTVFALAWYRLARGPRLPLLPPASAAPPLDRLGDPRPANARRGSR